MIIPFELNVIYINSIKYIALLCSRNKQNDSLLRCVLCYLKLYGVKHIHGISQVHLPELCQVYPSHMIVLVFTTKYYL